MVKSRMAQNPVNVKLPVETVVIDEEEITTPLPVNDEAIHRDFDTDLAGPSHPVTARDISENPSLSVEVQPVETGVDVTLVRDSPPSVDKKVQEVQVDCMTNSVVNEKPVKTTSAVTHAIGETMHPMFITCLLDKVHRMEDRMNEIVASRDLLKADNAGLRTNASLMTEES